MPVISVADWIKGGQGQFGTDESAFYSVLCLRSFPQLRCTFEKYRDIAGISIEEAITNETSGFLREGLLAIGNLAQTFIRTSNHLCGYTSLHTEPVNLT